VDAAVIAGWHRASLGRLAWVWNPGA